MPVPSTIADLSTNPSSNYPAGSDLPSALDDAQRSLAAIVKQNVSKGVDIASASTITIPSTGNYFVVTGTTGISAINDAWFGRTVVLKFSGILTLTNSAGLILPGNITTAAGACLIVTNESTGVWRAIAYQPSGGMLPLSGGALTGQLTFKAGADIASAATIDLTAATGNINRVTGTTATTGWTINAGQIVKLVAVAAWPLTYHATNNPVPGGVSRTCDPDDVITVSKDANDSIHIEITKFDGTAVVAHGTPASRQTVLSGPLNSSGDATFGGSTGSTTVTAAGTLVVAAANGSTDRIGSITNPSWTGITANSYGTLTVNSDGTCTTNVRTLAPIYQRAGTPSTTLGQLTFNWQEMKMYLGNGASADEVYEVVVGKFTASGTVSAITWFQTLGTYYRDQLVCAVSTAYSYNHNIGIAPLKLITWIECTTASAGYAVGDRIYSTWGDSNGTGAFGGPLWTTDLAVGLTTGAAAGGWINAPNKSTSAQGALAYASWKLGFEIKRAF